MTPERFRDLAVIPALGLLPPVMDSTAARAMILAVCLQESELKARRQMPKGPARGYAQYEGGKNQALDGVLKHHASRAHARAVCEALDIAPTLSAVYAAVQYQDVLCAAMARLLLWTDKEALPLADRPDAAWAIYLRTWRPGKPHRERWNANYGLGWRTALGE